MSLPDMWRNTMLADVFTRDDTLRFDVSGATPRIAVGLLWQETNAFNPLPTTERDFIVDRGEAMIEAYGQSATVLGGIVRSLRRRGGALVPILAAKARPGGPIDEAFVDAIISEFVKTIERLNPDAICLELHGATVGSKTLDVEAWLLESLREVVGPGVPIVVGLDLHGNCTQRMVDAADYLTGYRTQPHADMVETGERTASVLVAMLTRGLSPRPQRIGLPFLALTNDETDDPPMRAVWAEARRAEAEAGAPVVDLSIFNVHPFLDVAGMGQTVLAYDDGSSGAALAVATRVAAALDQVKYDFSSLAPSIEEVFEQIAAERGAGTAVIGDQGDSVLAGTPGDSVEIVRAAAAFGELKGFAPVFDPDTVRQAQAAGVGAALSLQLGGSISPDLASIRGEGLVERLTDGRFANVAGYMTGLLNDLGPCAVIRRGELVLLVTSKAPGVCDPAMVVHAGYTATDFDYLVMKSGNHFKLSFGPPFRSFVAATAGLSSRNPRHLRHVRAGQIFPPAG